MKGLSDIFLLLRKSDLKYFCIMYFYGHLTRLCTEISATVRCYDLKLNHQKDLIEGCRKMHLAQNLRKCRLTPSCMGPFNYFIIVPNAFRKKKNPHRRPLRAFR